MSNRLVRGPEAHEGFYFFGQLHPRGDVFKRDPTTSMTEAIALRTIPVDIYKKPGGQIVYGNRNAHEIRNLYRFQSTIYDGIVSTMTIHQLNGRDQQVFDGKMNKIQLSQKTPF